MFRVLSHTFMIINFCYLLDSYKTRSVGSMALNLATMFIYGMGIGISLYKAEKEGDR